MSLVVVNKQVHHNQSMNELATHVTLAAACNFTITAIFTNIDKGLVAAAYGVVASCVHAATKHIFQKLEIEIPFKETIIAGSSLAAALFITDQAAGLLGHSLGLHLPGSVFYNLFLS